MKSPRFDSTHVTFPLIGAASISQAVGMSAGLLATLFLVGGIWFVGAAFFDTSLDLHDGTVLLLALAGLCGSALYVVAQWAGVAWLFAWVLSVLWVFAATAYVRTLFHFLRR